MSKSVWQRLQDRQQKADVAPPLPFSNVWREDARPTGEKKRKRRPDLHGQYVKFDSVPPEGRRMERSDFFGVAIYALLDPRDMTVRYVGYTRKGLMERLANHVAKPPNERMREWIQRLRSSGQGPLIRAITFVANDRWESAEMHWIAWFRVRGRLLNKDPGGLYRDGGGRVRESAKTLAKAHARSAVEAKRGAE